MTAPSSEYASYVIKQLTPFGLLQVNKFFGGIGISNGFAQFAMIMGENLYFTVDNSTRQNYVNAGMQPFSYQTKKGLVTVRKYFTVPDEVLDDSEQLRLWVNEAMIVAARTKPNKPVRNNNSTSLS